MPESDREWMMRHLSATTGGPSAVQEEEAIAQEQTGKKPLAAFAEHPIQTGVEVAGQMANTITGGNPPRFVAENIGMGVGSRAVGALGRWASSRLGQKLLPGLSERGAELMAHYGERLGRIPGAGLGVVAGGEAAQVFADETPEEASQRRLHGFFAGGLAEAAVPLAQTLTRPISNAVRRTLKPYSEEIIRPNVPRIQGMLESRGLDPLSPGQSMGGWVDLWENLGASSVLGGGMVAGRREAGVRSALQNWEMTVESFGGRATAEQSMKAVTSALDNASIIQRAYTRGKYGVLDSESRAAGGVPGINLHPILKTELTDNLRRMRALDPPDPDASRILSLLESGAPFSRAVPAQPSTVLNPRGEPAFVTPGQPALPLTVDFKLANEIRSDLQAIGRRDDLPIPSVKALAKQAGAEVDSAINAEMDRLGTLGTKVKKASDEAREVSRWSKETFNDPAVVDFLNKSTKEEAARFLLADKTPSRLNRVYSILTNERFRDKIPDPDAIWRQVQGTWFEDLEIASGKGPGEYGTVRGKALMDQVRTAGGTVHALFRTPEARQALFDSGHAIDLAQNPGGSHIGSLAVGLRQSAAMVSVASQAGAIATGGFMSFGTKGLGASGVILGAPWVIARAMASPRVAKAMQRWVETRSTRVGYRSAQIAAYSVSRIMAEEGLPHVIKDPDGNLINPFKLIEGGQKPQSKF